MIDENAYGFLLSYFSIEDDEYGLEPEEFVERWREFREVALRFTRERPPGERARGIDLGHAVYFEVAEGDERGDPIAWLRALRAELAERELATVAVLSHGGRWVDESDAASGEPPGGVELVRASLPSEPLRRALYADAASRVDEDAAEPGWGPGLYVDSEAVEALGRVLKNAPTALLAGGAAFYRAGR